MYSPTCHSHHPEKLRLRHGFAYVQARPLEAQHFSSTGKRCTSWPAGGTILGACPKGIEVSEGPILLLQGEKLDSALRIGALGSVLGKLLLRKQEGT